MLTELVFTVSVLATQRRLLMLIYVMTLNNLDVWCRLRAGSKPVLRMFTNLLNPDSHKRIDNLDLHKAVKEHN